MSCGSRFKRPTSRWFTLWFSNVEQDVPPSEKIEKILYYSVVLCYVIYFLIRLRFPELQVVVTWTHFVSQFIWHNVNAIWKVFSIVCCFVSRSIASADDVATFKRDETSPSPGEFFYCDNTHNLPTQKKETNGQNKKNHQRAKLWNFVGRGWKGKIHIKPLKSLGRK